MTMSNDLSQGMSIGTTLGLLGSLNRSIVSEYGDTTAGTHSLSEFYAGGNNVPAGTSGAYGAIPSSGTIAMSKFFNSTKVTNIHETTMVAGYSAQQYVTISGYSTSVAGDSLGDDSITSICGQSGVTITQLDNVNLSLRLGLSKSGATFSNTGWTTMKVWVGQNNNSGTPTATFPRTGTGSYHSGSTSFSSSSGSCLYLWSDVAYANAFGTTHQGNCFIEIV
jgi:hypothetical protein